LTAGQQEPADPQRVLGRWQKIATVIGKRGGGSSIRVGITADVPGGKGLADGR
jgi:hypothetical protein